nr:MAG TPA: hypothetical protein [Caudoviricetes sp.]
MNIQIFRDIWENDTATRTSPVEFIYFIRYKLYLDIIKAAVIELVDKII